MLNSTGADRRRGGGAAKGRPERRRATLVAALALTGHDAEAREPLQRYLALPSTGPLKTITAWKAYYSAQGGDPPRAEFNELTYDGLRKAGMPED